MRVNNKLKCTIVQMQILFVFYRYLPTEKSETQALTLFTVLCTFVLTFTCVRRLP